MTQVFTNSRFFKAVLAAVFAVTLIAAAPKEAEARRGGAFIAGLAIGAIAAGAIAHSHRAHGYYGHGYYGHSYYDYGYSCRRVRRCHRVRDVYWRHGVKHVVHHRRCHVRRVCH